MCEQMRENARRFLKKITWPIESVQSHSFSFDWKTHRRIIMRSQILCHTLFAFRFPPFPLSFLFFFFALFLVFFFFHFFQKRHETPIFFLCVHISFNILVVVHLAMKIDAFTVYDVLTKLILDD